MLNYSSVLLRLVEHTLRLEQFYGCLFQPMYTLCICHQLCVEYCTATWRHPGLSIVNQWELSNITCMNRIDQSHAPKLVTEDEQTRDRQGKKWLIGLSAHARAKNEFDISILMESLFIYVLKPAHISKFGVQIFLPMRKGLQKFVGPP